MENTGDDFRAWVDRYLLPGSQLAVNSSDLWGARCGMLHSYTPESGDFRKGKARKVWYVAGVLDATVSRSGLAAGQYVGLVSQDLFDALSSALQRFEDDLTADPELEQRVVARAAEFLVPWSPQPPTDPGNRS